MKLIETFLLGFLIACASLIIQVLFTVIAELFFSTSIEFLYTTEDTMQHVIFLMLVAATIEELLRYAVIKKRILLHTNSTSSILIYGMLFGTGFAGFETVLLLANYGLAIIATSLMLLPVFAIHIILSIFLLSVIKYNRTLPRNMPYIIIAIIFHVLSNFVLFHLFAL